VARVEACQLYVKAVGHVRPWRRGEALAERECSVGPSYAGIRTDSYPTTVRPAHMLNHPLFFPVMTASPYSNGSSAVAVPPLQDGFVPTELHDRVVIMLLFDQVVSEADVRAAWAKRRQSGDARRALWRVLASVEGVAADAVFAEAARVYGFNSMRLDTNTAVRQMRHVRKQTDLQRWLALLNTAVVPVAKTEGRMIFATHDPTRPAVRKAIGKVWAKPYDLRYTNRAAVVNVINAATQRRQAYARPAERFTAPWGSDPTPAYPPPGDRAPGTLDRPTFMRLLEGALVGMVQKGIALVCLVPNAGDETEVFLQEDGRLRPWYTEQRVPAQVLLAALKSYILEVSNEQPQASRTRTIQRWIDGTRVSFAMDWLAEPERLPCACIRVVS